MSAGKKHFVIEKGATFSRESVWRTIPVDDYDPPMTQAEIEAASTPVNVTGYTASLKLLTDHDSDTPLLELTESSGITLGGVAGTIGITITDAQTAALEIGSGVFRLDLTSSGGDVQRVIKGTFEVVW